MRGRVPPPCVVPDTLALCLGQWTLPSMDVMSYHVHIVLGSGTKKAAAPRPIRYDTCARRGRTVESTVFRRDEKLRFKVLDGPCPWKSSKPFGVTLNDHHPDRRRRRRSIPLTHPSVREAVLPEPPPAPPLRRLRPTRFEEATAQMSMLAKRQQARCSETWV
ncbi:hypothetical protein FZEAL_3035 [Fusarium zealandicum]|uniref:Uncharacterized protein n=1 Tax=Fusarium zealandicum TaxID=1053134 RepID=A0A8H4UQ88_9HYPO|nr:hypothetical protein FZEAL_3035 [Fusarium zealandicum]